MGLISVDYPVPGDPNSSEDQKVLDALQTIVNAVNALDNANIASAAGIEGSKLANTSIAAAKLAANAVEEAKILNGAVTTDKIGNDAVTDLKLRDDASVDANRAVTTNHIRDAAVTTAKIGNAQVTGAKIAASTTGTVTNGSGVNGTVTARKYADGMVLIEGSVTKAAGTWTSSTAISFTLGTLPDGFKPTEGIATVRASSNSGNLGFNYVSIGTNGSIALWVPAPFSETVTTVSLGGITYHAA